MLLVHAQALAVEYVVLNGVQFPKAGPFTPDQLASEDWVPIQVSSDVSVAAPAGDCGCGEAKAGTAGVSTEGVSPQGDSSANDTITLPSGESSI